MKNYKDIFPQNPRKIGKKKVRISKKDFDEIKENLVKENKAKK